MESRKKILVVDDDKEIQFLFSDVLKGEFIVLQALTIEEAEHLFSENSDIALVVMDGCVPGCELNTVPLVKKFRETFVGPMIASGSYPTDRELLRAEGCTHETRMKYEVPNLVRNLLC